MTTDPNQHAMWTRIDGLRDKIDELLGVVTTLREDFSVFKGKVEQVDLLDMKLRLNAVEHQVLIMKTEMDQSKGRRFDLFKTLLPWMVTTLFGIAATAFAAGWRPH